MLTLFHHWLISHGAPEAGVQIMIALCVCGGHSWSCGSSADHASCSNQTALSQDSLLRGYAHGWRRQTQRQAVSCQQCDNSGRHHVGVIVLDSVAAFFCFSSVLVFDKSPPSYLHYCQLFCLFFTTAMNNKQCYFLSHSKRPERKKISTMVSNHKVTNEWYWGQVVAMVYV